MQGSSRILGGRYVLAVKDLKASVRFYQDQLDMKTVWSGEGWHFLKREGFVVMLGECPDDLSAFETNNHSYFAYIEVDNIDSLYREFTGREIKMGELEDKPWGQREFAVTTLDGHRIMFGQEITS